MLIHRYILLPPPPPPTFAKPILLELLLKKLIDNMYLFSPSPNFELTSNAIYKTADRRLKCFFILMKTIQIPTSRQF